MCNQQRLMHIPQRTCVACREVKPSRQLIRLVRAGDSVVEVDLSGKKAGRGAYLCYKSSCWEDGLKRARLERTLRTKISAENRAKLTEFGKMLPNHKPTLENQRWQ